MGTSHIKNFTKFPHHKHRAKKLLHKINECKIKIKIKKTIKNNNYYYLQLNICKLHAACKLHILSE